MNRNRVLNSHLAKVMFFKKKKENKKVPFSSHQITKKITHFDLTLLLSLFLKLIIHLTSLY